MAIIFLIGRILFGGFFLVNAYNHLVRYKGLAGYAASKGVPGAAGAVIGSGILLLIGGLSMVLGLYPRLGVLALALFLIPTTFVMHAYWKEADAGARAAQQIQFRKNLALLGAALMMLMIAQPWVYSLSW